MFGIEANFPESLAVNSYVEHGTGTAAHALTGLRKWPWNTEEVLALIEWMRAWNAAHGRTTRFYGFDMSPVTVAALEVCDYLKRVAGDLAAGCEAALAPLSTDFTEALFGQLPVPIREAALACIERVFAAFARERATWSAATGEREWRLARLHAIALEQGARMAIPMAAGDELGLFSIRDQAMAENVRSLLDVEGRDTRAVLWSHNDHAGRSSFRYAGVDIPLMGRHLAEFFGREQLVVGFAFNQGSFLAWTHPGGGLTAHSVPPAPEGSFEAPLAAAGLPLFALDLKSAPSEGSVAQWLASPRRRSFVANYSAEFQARLDAALDVIFTRPRDKFDVIIFVDSTTPSRPNQSLVRTHAAPQTTAATPTNIDLLEGDKIPNGWTQSGYQEPFAHTIALSDEPSPSDGRTVSIARRSAPWRWGDGVLVQKFAADRWRGQRLRFGASIRAMAEVAGTGAQLFLRVWRRSADGSSDLLAGLATMADRPVRAAEWGRHAVEVDVPTNADAIEIGLVVTGNSAAWFGDLKLEPA
jgi:erythromycin esterase